MFHKFTNSTRLYISCYVSNPSHTSIESVIHMLRTIPEFESVTVDYKISNMRGHETLRSTSIELHKKDDAINALQKIMYPDDKPDLS